MKTKVVLNERGTSLRLEAENEFERALIEFLDFNYSASVFIEREERNSYLSYRESRPAKAAIFTLLRDADEPQPTKPVVSESQPTTE